MHKTAARPLVSVIIPTYNRAGLVGEAIQSVLEQSLDDLEVLVIDDGSTDQTEELVSSIADARLVYIKQPNQGPSAARNRGLAVARGELFAFLDSDDLYLPHKLELQLAALERAPQAGLAYSLFYEETAARSERQLSGLCHPQLGLQDLILGPVFHWSTVLVRREWIERVGGFGEAFFVGEDWELTLRLALAGCQMVCVPRPLSVARIQPVSLSRNLYRYETSARSALEKTFAAPEFPPALRRLMDRAYALQLVRLGASAFLSGDAGCGQAYLERALETEPGLADGHIDLFAQRLVNYLSGLSMGDPEVTIRQVLGHLPGQQSFQRRLTRRIWACYYLDAAFRANQLGDRLHCRRFARKAVAARPGLLRNRGLVSIYLQSLGLRSARSRPWPDEYSG